MTEPTVEMKALFYHLAVEHRVTTADFQGGSLEDMEALHEALHDLGHAAYRMPTKARPKEEVIREERRWPLEEDEARFDRIARNK